MAFSKGVDAKPPLADMDTDTVNGDELFSLPRYRPKDINKLCSSYKFTKAEIRVMYQGFKQSFLSLLSCISRGSVSEKITWMFNLYDLKRTGYITREGMLNVFEAIHQIIEINVFVSSTSQCPPSIGDLVDKVFAEMDINKDNKVTFQEFNEWCLRDPKIIDNVRIFDTVM
ncbi:Neuronal calcium sensor 1 [Halotydeus destructor]|nr:Neuronal calcium sensor 1 [Halotydeus destructor]